MKNKEINLSSYDPHNMCVFEHNLAEDALGARGIVSSTDHDVQ